MKKRVPYEDARSNAVFSFTEKKYNSLQIYLKIEQNTTIWRKPLRKSFKKSQFDRFYWLASKFRTHPLTKPTCSFPRAMQLHTPILPRMELSETFKQVWGSLHLEKFWRIKNERCFFSENDVEKFLTKPWIQNLIFLTSSRSPITHFSSYRKLHHTLQPIQLPPPPTDPTPPPPHTHTHTKQRQHNGCAK